MRLVFFNPLLTPIAQDWQTKPGILISMSGFILGDAYELATKRRGSIHFMVYRDYRVLLVEFLIVLLCR